MPRKWRIAVFRARYAEITHAKTPTHGGGGVQENVIFKAKL